MSQPPHTAARRLVETLVVNGIDRVFCVPGESYLAVLDALADVRDRIQVVTCRHEAGAANMAEAYGKLTGKPGVCMVTRGPGATHASIGVHTAHQDSTPMILFVGQIASVLGSGPIADFAAKLGISPEQASETLAGLLPEAVDRLTPNGQVPDMGGLLDQLPGGLGDIVGGFLKR